MRNYIILNGVNSNTITGLLISTLPPITKPKIRTQTEEIDGRDGDIVTKLGYSAYDKEIEIGLYGNFDINEVIAYFNTEGTVVFSNEADKYYNYQILDQIDYEKLIRFKTAKVKMHVQPFKYPLEETPVEINIQNVTGSGETISLDNTAEAPLTLALKGNTSQGENPTPTTPQDIHIVSGDNTITVSNSDNTQSQTYPITLPIGTELCKIGTYQDYIYKDNNKWYIHKEIGRVVLDGSETINSISNARYRIPLQISAGDGYDTSISKCNLFRTIGHFEIATTTKENVMAVNGGYVYIRVTSSTTLQEVITLLSNTNAIVYYVLEIPEDEEITDNTLIGQLNALENARSYDPTTHINQNTANKPFIINATAVQKGTDTGTIDNIGNIYAKPTIDIEGSGIVEIYLDGNQIFNVDLSTINECIIDTTNLEAYNPATTQLMNRQVTGDYSNFKINVGDNQVKVSGAVTKATISNYTRWL